MLRDVEIFLNRLDGHGLEIFVNSHAEILPACPGSAITHISAGAARSAVELLDKLRQMSNVVEEVVDAGITTETKLRNYLVGARGFEPPTPCAQGRCATRLRYAPTLRMVLSIITDCFPGHGTSTAFGSHTGL